MHQKWPDELRKPSTQEISDLLADFWMRVADLSDLVANNENLLCAECLAGVRSILIRLVLALNGVARPDGTSSLNTYLSPRQRTALDKTLVAPAAGRDAWIGQAVAMVVIYRWYAPQLVDAYHVPYPEAVEHESLNRLSATIAGWPKNISTE